MKVLVVDDEKHIIEIYTLYCDTIEGIEPISAYSGNEAIEIIKQNPDIALIVSDYQMPDGNGMELFNYVRQKRLQIPFIMISANNQEDLPGHKEMSESPHFYFMKKPIRLEELERLMKSLLYHKAA